MKSDPYCRAVGFDSSVESHIDVRFDPQIVPQTFEEHYTIELFAKLTGGADSVRALYGSGRYSLFVSRDGWLVVTVVDGLSEVSIRVCPCLINQWKHIITTFDGTYRAGICERQGTNRN